MLLPFVLEDTLQEIARYSDVKRVAAAGRRVDAVGAFVHEDMAGQ
jgi:hypothetical protein